MRRSKTSLLRRPAMSVPADHVPREVSELSAENRQHAGEMHGGAVVVWSGGLQSGTGSLRFESGAGAELPLLWPGSDRYEPGTTTPEELTAAAHAACFTMTLAHTLARNGHSTKNITASAVT